MKVSLVLILYGGSILYKTCNGSQHQEVLFSLQFYSNHSSVRGIILCTSFRDICAQTHPRKLGVLCSISFGMRLLLCSAVLATAIFGVYGFPTDLADPAVPRRGGNPNNKPLQSGVEKPKPNMNSKPAPQVTDSLQAAQNPSAYILEVAQSSVSSELPAAELPAEGPSAPADAPEVLSISPELPVTADAPEVLSMSAEVPSVSAEAPEVPSIGTPGDAPEILSVSASVPEVPNVSADVPEVLSVSAEMLAEPAHDPILETSNNFHAAEGVIQDAIPEIDIPAEVAPVAIEQELLSGIASDAVSSAAAEAPEIDTGMQEIVDDVNNQLHNSDAKVYLSAIRGKSRRHAGVELPSALRIGDFEDVEADTSLAAPEYPANQEQVEMSSDVSKEEMILMAMEQMHHNLPHMQLNAAARPVANRGSHMNSGTILGKPQTFSGDFSDHEEDEDPSENDSTVDLRNGESATIVQEQPVVPTVSKVVQSSKNNAGINSDSIPHSPYGSGSRNKPRPYGMDKPSKNRPTLDSGMKDKNEHFGLPHSSSNDYVQKGEMGLSSNSDPGTTSYLGFQIPSIKWVSFTDLFPNFWGTRINRQHGLGKSDQALEQSEACVEDSEAEAGVRSPVIQSSTLCHASGVSSTCQQACVDNGFAQGSCLGPYPTPGCLCRMPKSDEFGLLLKPLGETEESPAPDANRAQELDTSSSPACKKCSCIESCKQSGSYTGMCLDKCYCAVPWYFKQGN